MNSNDIKQEWLSLYKSNSTTIGQEKLRDEALAFFEATDFPTRKTESWKNTNVSPILGHVYVQGAAKSISKAVVDQYLIPGLEANLLVFVNGNYSEELSQIICDPSELTIKSFSQPLNGQASLVDESIGATKIHEDNIFAAYNAAFFTDGALIVSKQGKLVRKPIMILHLVDGSTEASLALPRNLIVAEPGSQLSVVEVYASLGGGISLNNITTEVLVGEDASVSIDRLQNENKEAFQVNTMSVIQKQQSHFACNTISLGGAIVRNEVKVSIQGEHCETNVNGLYLPKGKQHVDNYTVVRHEKPHCTSNQLFKGVADDEATAVFLGMVYVARGAQKTDAYQTNKNVVMTNKAKVNSKPQLEIYADDVKCSHGSTTGQIDANALFYLRSRGIPEAKAKGLMLHAYAKQVIEKSKNQAFQEFTEELVTATIEN